MSKEKAKIQSIDEELQSTGMEMVDGLQNFIASMGSGGDKRSYSKFSNQKRLSAEGNEIELNALYRTDWLSGKVVDIIPDDMTREWISFIGDDDPDLVQKLQDESDRLDIRGNFNMAHKWGRLYGTALVVMAIDDGQEPDKPLNMDAIKEGGLQHLKVVDRHRFEKSEAVPIQNPLDPNYGMPEFYRFVETSVKIHHSRVLRFDGVRLPFDEFRRNNYFSDSVLDRLYESLINLNTACNGSASMIHETNVDVVKVQGLMDHLMTAEGESKLKKRFALAKLLKSFNNIMLLDNQEEFIRQQNTFAGLSDLIDRFAQLLSAATDIPATRLLGSSASGLNATGEGDLKNYYDKVRSMQISEYKPRLDTLFEIMARSMRLPKEEPVKYEFNSLFQQTPKEEAETNYNNAQTAKIYWDIGAVDQVVVAKELKQQGTYGAIDKEYIEEMEDFSSGGLDLNNPELQTREGEEDEREQQKNNANNPEAQQELGIDPQESLNGAQVTAILEIIKRVQIGEIPKSTAIRVMGTAFPITEQEAQLILQQVKEGELKANERASTDPERTRPEDEE